MPLDAVDDGGVSPQDPNQIPARFLPDEDVAVVAARGHVATPTGVAPEEDGFLDVRVRVAVAAESEVVVGYGATPRGGGEVGVETAGGGGSTPVAMVMVAV